MRMKFGQLSLRHLALMLKLVFDREHIFKMLNQQKYTFCWQKKEDIKIFVDTRTPTVFVMACFEKLKGNISHRTHLKQAV